MNENVVEFLVGFQPILQALHFDKNIWSLTIAMIILALAIPVILFVVFWTYAIKRQWRFISLLAGSIALLLMVTTFIIYFYHLEKWILGVGLSFSLLVGIAILSIPLISPELMKTINFNANVERGFYGGSQKREILSAIYIFFFIVVGYWIIMYFVEPKEFFYDFVNQLWIIPVALAISSARFIIDYQKNK